MASRYHRGRGQDDPTKGVVAQVKGTSPVLPILGRGRRVCPFASGLHKLLWQQRIFLLGPGGCNSPYLPPHKAATAIQNVYLSYLCDRPYRQQVVESALSHKVYELERNMALAMRDLKDSDDFVYTVSNTAGSGTGFVRLPQVIWISHWAVASITHTTTAIPDPTTISDLWKLLAGLFEQLDWQ